MKMWQTMVERCKDTEGIRKGHYVVLDCFEVDVNLDLKTYNGRRVYRLPKRRAIVFLIMQVRGGEHISIRRLMGKQFQKAGRK